MATSPKYLQAFILTGAVLGLGHGLPAAADNPVQAETVSVEVTLADLDLGSEAGAGVAVGRIERAARRVCRDVAPRSLLAPRAVHECERETVASAIAELREDNVLLAANARAAN